MKTLHYFVSYTVVRGNDTNSAGHVYLVFSQLDANNRDARAEVTEAIGLYGHSLRKDQVIKRKIFPAELYGPGHLIQEHLRFIVETDKYSHQHKTWQITERQKNQLLQSIANDRQENTLPTRDFQSEKHYWDTLNELEQSRHPASKKRLQKLIDDEYMSINQFKGPFFNFYHNSCMSDAKRRLNAIGISTKQMDGYILDIPGLTSGALDIMKLEYQDRHIYWKSPLAISINENKASYTEHEKIRLIQLRAFSILYTFASTLKDQFQQKNSQLQQRGKAVLPLQHAENLLELLTEYLSKAAKFPNKIGANINLNCQFQLNNIIQDCYHSLHQSDVDAAIVKLVKAAVDFINGFFHYMASWFINNGHFIDAHPLKFSEFAIDTVQCMTEEIQRQHKVMI